MIKNAINAVKALLPESSNVTLGQIEEQVDFILAHPKFNLVDRDLLIRELKSQYTLVVESFRVIELDDPIRRKPWVSTKKINKEYWPFWMRYKNYLMYKKGFAPAVVDQLDKLTDRILDGLYDPAVDVGFDKKGLVVGQVQSGKTANYTGLICKAADAGFNLIIVLAGLHNNLRSQTQLRIDEGFLGFDTQFQRAFNTGQHLIGVGIGNTSLPVHSLTDSREQGDFSANGAVLNFHSKETIVAVVKKNSAVLKKLFQWLYNYSSTNGERKVISEKALLLIDDEADNASINTRGNPEERTAINNSIREILELFVKNGYVGYTATPFANIFIPSTERNDLFPRDFIINIPAPPNYIGPDKVFGFDFYDDETKVPDSVLPICVRIDQTEEEKAELENFVPQRHKREDRLPAQVPNSLRTAIKCFIITCAIRKARGQNREHNSMLVHVTRFQRWQSHVKELVENVFQYYKNGIDFEEPIVLEELRSTFEDDHNYYQSYKTISSRILNSNFREIDPNITVHQWSEIRPYLYEAVINTIVKEINGTSKEILDYYENKDNGLTVIAIGGDKLSRGLTLEGLSVSYYLRASKMYDTLMQMGRWFGYRNGYVDLCRLFTTGELNEWFCHIARATQELRDEFDYMSDKEGSTPEKYALKVRTHPGVLQISASNKIRSAVPIEISWAGRLVESYELVKDYEVTRANLSSLTELVERIDKKNRKEVKTGGSLVWYDVSAHDIISFFEKIKVCDNLKSYNPENIVRFIKQQLPNGELTSWRVALLSNSQTENHYGILNNSRKMGLFIRSEDPSSNSNIFYIRKSHIIDKKHESIDLNETEFQRAMKLTEEKWKKTGKPNCPSGEVIRKEIRDPKNPLLLLYLLDSNQVIKPTEWDIPFLGYAISFPRSSYHEPVRYAVNQTLLPYFNLDSNTMDYDDSED